MPPRGTVRARRGRSPPSYVVSSATSSRFVSSSGTAVASVPPTVRERFTSVRRRPAPHRLGPGRARLRAGVRGRGHRDRGRRHRHAHGLAVGRTRAICAVGLAPCRLPWQRPCGPVAWGRRCPPPRGGPGGGPAAFPPAGHPGRHAITTTWATTSTSWCSADDDVLVRPLCRPRQRAWSRPRSQARVDLPQARAPRPAPSARLLDVGCGWGSWRSTPRRAPEPGRRDHLERGAGGLRPPTGGARPDSRTGWRSACRTTGT